METTRTAQSGWTLTETLVAVVIVGLLVTIGLPLFQGQRATASNASAQSSLSTAYKSVIEMNFDVWPSSGALANALREFEPVYTYHASTTASAGPEDVSVQVNDVNMFTLCVQSKTRLFYCVRSDRLGQIDTDQLATVDRGSWLVPSAAAAEDPSNGTGPAARSTGATEAAARQALPTRTSGGTLTSRNARGWTDCVGSCAVAQAE